MPSFGAVLGSFSSASPYLVTPPLSFGAGSEGPYPIFPRNMQELRAMPHEQVDAFEAFYESGIPEAPTYSLEVRVHAVEIFIRN